MSTWKPIRFQAEFADLSVIRRLIKPTPKSSLRCRGTISGLNKVFWFECLLHQLHRNVLIVIVLQLVTNFIWIGVPVCWSGLVPPYGSLGSFATLSGRSAECLISMMMIAMRLIRIDDWWLIMISPLKISLRYDCENELRRFAFSWLAQSLKRRLDAFFLFFPPSRPLAATYESR